MKRNQVSAPELRARYQQNKERCRNVKPWSFELDGERYNVPTGNENRTGEPLIKGAYQDTNNKAQRNFQKRVAAGPRNISFEHKEKLERYAKKHSISDREAIERAIDLLPD